MSGIWKRKKRSDIQTPTNRKGRKQLRLNLTPPRQISTLPVVLRQFAFEFYAIPFGLRQVRRISLRIFPRPDRCERFPAVSSQELEQIGTLLFQLVHRALRWRLVRTPAQEAGAVPKTVLGGVIVTNLHDELRLNGPPFA